MAKMTVLKTGIELQQLSKYMIRFKSAIGAWELPAITSSRAADKVASRQQPCRVPRACWLQTPLAYRHAMTSQAPLHRHSKGRSHAQRENSRALDQSSKRKFEELEIMPSEAPLKPLGDAKAMQS
jgi:hypothetical protein